MIGLIHIVIAFNSDEEFCNLTLWTHNLSQVINDWMLNPDSIELVYGHISNWDVSNVIDISHLFSGALILTKIYQVGMCLMLLI